MMSVSGLLLIYGNLEDLGQTWESWGVDFHELRGGGEAALASVNTIQYNTYLIAFIVALSFAL